MRPMKVGDDIRLADGSTWRIVEMANGEMRAQRPTAARKTCQLNLKVTAHFYDRFASLARDRAMSMPKFLEWCLEMAERYEDLK